MIREFVSSSFPIHFFLTVVLDNIQISSTHLHSSDTLYKNTSEQVIITTSSTPNDIIRAEIVPIGKFVKKIKRHSSEIEFTLEILNVAIKTIANVLPVRIVSISTPQKMNSAVALEI